VDYKKTLNLPQTEFAMRAGLAQKEPRLLQQWEDEKLFGKIQAARAGGTPFRLHDGPPYANGTLHHGHILNKVLKDMAVKDRTMAGYAVSYIPGWDCHGLPIEVQVDKQLGGRKQEISQRDFRAACRTYAEQQVEAQRKSFKRLGVGASWDTPYLTMAYAYEAATIREFGRLHQRGLLYKGLRPTHWCLQHQTALAEAEIEYADHSSASAYVGFEVVEDTFPAALRAGEGPAWLVIWTTTPWTLPANQAIAVHPKLTYLIYALEGRRCIVAEPLLDAFLAAVGAPAVEPAQILGRMLGQELATMRYRHPFLDRESPVLCATYVTQDTGTGCVHTAPAHGVDDFALGKQHGLELRSPVGADGTLSAAAGPFAGAKVPAVGAAVLAHLQASGHLLSPLEARLRHRYPHCWRCHRPIIVRATEQWFVALDRPMDGGPSLRQRALAALDGVRWIPSWGQQRMAGMLKNRPDWCLSRQRLWGVPVVMAYCAGCAAPLEDPKLFAAVAQRTEKEGSDAWFERPLSDFLPDARCAACGKHDFVKETDILDVWFDSGVSFAAVMEAGCGEPVSDLVLEGSDQHRGWFHSALLIGLSTRNIVPYKTVLTHGFVVDGKGKKISKSLGNFIDPQKTIERDGAELLRLWVAQEDYRDDVRLSPQILARLSDTYRKVRNTLRFILANVSDFSPQSAGVSMAALPELDRLALGRHLHCVAAVRAAYAAYTFHQGISLLVDHCTSELSAFYFDILKDRLYASAPTSLGRRAAQTVLYLIGRDLVRLLAPVLCFTAEEAWGHLPKLLGDPPSVHLCLYPDQTVVDDPADGDFYGALRTAAGLVADPLGARYALLLELRRQVNLALEAGRRDKRVGSSVEARLYLADHPGLQPFSRAQLAEFFIVSGVDVVEGQAEAVRVDVAEGGRCARCWLYRPEVLPAIKADDEAAGALCGRCTEVLRDAA
jgi:isoleucyl-tRNA synthetase